MAAVVVSGVRSRSETYGQDGARCESDVRDPRLGIGRKYLFLEGRDVGLEGRGR